MNFPRIIMDHERNVSVLCVSLTWTRVEHLKSTFNITYSAKYEKKRSRKNKKLLIVHILICFNFNHISSSAIQRVFFKVSSQIIMDRERNVSVLWISIIWTKKLFIWRILLISPIIQNTKCAKQHSSKNKTLLIVHILIYSINYNINLFLIYKRNISVL